MLDKNVISSVLPIALDLDSKLMGAQPVPNTFLDSLTRLSGADQLYVNSDDFNVDGYIEQVSRNASAVNEVTGYSEHCVRMNELSQQIADAVAGHLRFAQTTVAPLTGEFYDKVTNHVDVLMRDNLLDLEICIKDIPAPLSEPALIEKIKKGEDFLPTQMSSTGIYIPIISAEEITKLMMTGATNADAAITEFISSIGDEKLISIFASLFNDESHNGDNGAALSVTDDYIFDGENGLEKALVAWLLASNIWDKPLEGIEMELRSYEDKMISLRNEAVAILNAKLQYFKSMEDQEIVIIHADYFKINVFGPVYRKYIAEGGSNEVIFGSCVCNETGLNIEALNSSNAEYCTAWDNYCAVNATTEANRKFVAVKQAAQSEFAAILSNLTEEDLPIQQRPAAMDKFICMLDETCTNDLVAENIGDWCLRLICGSLFDKTDAYRILSGIDAVIKRSPNVDVKKAASISAVNYIVHWVCTQLTTEHQAVPAGMMMGRQGY